MPDTLTDPGSRLKILLINPQEQKPLARMGLAPYEDWIATVTRLPADRIQVVNIADGDRLPGTIDATAVIGVGSGHSSFENLAWIHRAKEFFQQVRRQGVPELHICWSHQAKAETLGATVARGENGRRFGIETLFLTEAGRRDPLFRGLPGSFEIFCSHVDSVVKPPEADFTELAFSLHYRYEALSYGATCRTIQAHPELTSEIVTALAHQRRPHLISEGLLGPDPADYEDFLVNLKERNDEIVANSQHLIANWLTYLVIPHMQG